MDCCRAMFAALGRMPHWTAMSCAASSSHWRENTGVSKVCPPGGNRVCDWCRQPLPQPHPPGEHRTDDVVLTFSAGAPGRGRWIRHYIHSEPLTDRSDARETGQSHDAHRAGPTGASGLLTATLTATTVVLGVTLWTRWIEAARGRVDMRLWTPPWTAPAETFNPRVLGSNPSRPSTNPRVKRSSRGP